LASRARRRGCLPIVGLAAITLILGAAAYLTVALRMPQDAPLAMMYRTEAGLAALGKALDVYHGANGAYPPPGQEGLGMAVAALSKKMDYMPGQVYLDSWDRPWHYVAAPRYAGPGSEALLTADGSYCAPDSYQLYSLGADGEAGLASAPERGDNICSWDAGKPWRAAYEAYQRAFETRKQATP
jgi:Type II secretion system (T2SS), protein G